MLEPVMEKFLESYAEHGYKTLVNERFADYEMTAEQWKLAQAVLDGLRTGSGPGLIAAAEIWTDMLEDHEDWSLTREAPRPVPEFRISPGHRSAVPG
jgi:hypothetical protein